MSIRWTAQRRQFVEAEIQNHPADSGRCDVLAGAILPAAVQQDADAYIAKLEPRLGRFVLPQRRWFYHVTTSVERHYVDALTGVDGHAADSYASAYFPYPDAILWTKVR